MGILQLSEKSLFIQETLIFVTPIQRLLSLLKLGNYWWLAVDCWWLAAKFSLNQPEPRVGESKNCRALHVLLVIQPFVYSASAVVSPLPTSLFCFGLTSQTVRNNVKHSWMDNSTVIQCRFSLCQNNTTATAIQYHTMQFLILHKCVAAFL